MSAYIHKEILAIEAICIAEYVMALSIYVVERLLLYYCKRAILFLSSSKILTPHPPLRPANLSSPRNKGGGTHSSGGEGGGGSIFWKTRVLGLPSYSNNLSTIYVRRMEKYQIPKIFIFG